MINNECDWRPFNVLSVLRKFFITKYGYDWN